jgi:hypothetical protein
VAIPIRIAIAGGFCLNFIVEDKGFLISSPMPMNKREITYNMAPQYSPVINNEDIESPKMPLQPERSSKEIIKAILMNFIITLNSLRYICFMRIRNPRILYGEKCVNYLHYCRLIYKAIH